MWTYNYDNELYHFGIKGMKWGVRKFQNSDGSLTSAGRRRYSDAEQNVRRSRANTSFGNRLYTRAANAAQRDADDLRKHGYNIEADAVQKVADRNREKAATSQKRSDAKKEYANTSEGQARARKAKKALKIGAAVAGTALAAYGAKKVYDIAKEKKVKAGEITADKRKLDIVNSTYNQAMEMLKDNEGSSNPITGGRVYDKYGYYEVIKNATEQGVRRHNY